MKTARILITALALVATINAPLLASGGRRVCYPCYRPSYVAPTVTVEAKGVPAAAPNYSTSSTDNSVSYTYNIQYGQLPAAQGDTLYGYRASTYSNTDLGVDNYISQRLVADASAIQSKVLSGQQANAAAAAEIAKLQIKGQIITSALNALADTSAANGGDASATFTQNIQASASASVGSSDNQLATKVTQLVTQKCVGCHGPTRQAGNLDLSNLANVDGAKVLARVTSADPTKRMPLAAGDTPGTPLSVGELSTLFAAVGQVE